MWKRNSLIVSACLVFVTILVLLISQLRIRTAGDPSKALVVAPDSVSPKSMEEAESGTLSYSPDQEQDSAAALGNQTPERELVPSRPITDRTPTSDWLASRAAMEVGDLMNERAILEVRLSGLSEPELEKRFEAGATEQVSFEREYKVTKEDLSSICSIRMVNGRGTFRTVLPRDEYPEMYELKDKILSLTSLIEKRSKEMALKAR